MQTEDVVDTMQKSSAVINLDTVPSPKKRSVTHLKNGDTNGKSETNGNGEPLLSPTLPGLQFSQIRSTKRIERPEDGISFETATQIPVLVDPQTGEKLTLAQAVSTTGFSI
jgi:hypothetical protein